ncbi:glycosyltransferase family 4 protein [Psychrobium sp. 1_MG-2023]|uniref:glycosyltransferase family 4 protein n=1 Tax=Psychrobium sp. 1_MG-2023 TaxID=3062624 RepID=UPI000C3401B2|nr:glycosyltransferase family 4 protein [Psychrobium sp. 1_MG-2023]MDP2561326.1 glycosyltransferase family 4 protein [Psychrobium sp. 1_MG-2023]PKF54140.1 glycosyltransferase [Alteromonadales bacterium alter-6D02]
MSKSKHIVVLDTIAFAGGSKVATNSLLLSITQPHTRITIITGDKASWANSHYQLQTLWRWSWLENLEQGIGYFLRHLILAMNVMIVRVRFGKIDVAVGASGPGVDLALYMAQLVFGFSIIQLIHGPVAASRTIARCLERAQAVFYLASTLQSILQSLARLMTEKQIAQHLTASHYQEFKNGLPAVDWPSQCQYRQARILWAASLLKWKGLDLFIEASKRLVSKQPLDIDICYIRPVATLQPVSQAPVPLMADRATSTSLIKQCGRRQYLPQVHWYEQPKDLDAIRSGCNIFVSTSIKEPFGLSILEALAAGLCVLIPSDGAYWDKELTDGLNCIKYKPNDPQDLHQKLDVVCNNTALIQQIGLQGQDIAQTYQAEQLYRPVHQVIFC